VLVTLSFLACRRLRKDWPDLHAQVTEIKAGRTRPGFYFVVFRDSLCGVSEHCPGELPYIQRYQSGLIIALVCCIL
jgi:hypothetical protein